MSYTLIRVKKVWHFRFQVDGHRIQKTTRETVRHRAEPIAQRAYEEAKLWARGEAPVPSLSALIDQWIDVHSPVSSDSHIRSVETFKKLHLYGLGDMPISQISTDDVERARNEHLKTHAPASVNHWLRILKLTCVWAVKREIIPKLPWRVPMQKTQKRPRTILPVASAKAWLDAIDARTVETPSIATALRLMLGLGLRESEASGARWEWVDWERLTYTPGITKGKEAQPVPIPAWLADHLQLTRAESGLIAPKASGQRYAPGYAREAMRTANHVCGIKGLTPHRLRGTFATLLSEAGVPIQTIQRVMRHKSPMTTMAYLEISLETASIGQTEIAEKMGFGGFENGERPHAEPRQITTSTLSPVIGDISRTTP